MNDIGQRLLNEANLLVKDQAYYFEKLLKNPNDFLTWNDVEWCMNNPYLYNFEMIDKYNNKIDIPEHRKAWIWNRYIQDKSFIFKKFYEGNSLIIMNYGFHSEKTMQLLDIFEKLFDIHAAIHVYCGLENSKSFPIHDDYPANFIIQVEGKTKWRIYKNRISYLYKTGTMNNKLDEKDLEVDIEIELTPGDALYIPARAFHSAEPSGKRLSISIPCWNRFSNDPENYYVDRNIYRIDKDV